MYIIFYIHIYIYALNPNNSSIETKGDPVVVTDQLLVTEAFSQLGVGGTELEAVNEKEGVYSETWRKCKKKMRKLLQFWTQIWKLLQLEIQTWVGSSSE